MEQDKETPLWQVIKLSQGGPIKDVLVQGIDRLFKMGASDITIQSDDFVFAYIDRKHQQASDMRLDHGQVSLFASYIYGNGQNPDQTVLAKLNEGSPQDFEAELQPLHDEPDYLLRCRVNACSARVGIEAKGISITMRTIPDKPHALSSLDLHEDIVESIMPTQGLSLVCGITGSGKSTLLSSVIREMLENPENPRKIMLFEDPIEQVYTRMATHRFSEPEKPTRIGGRMPEAAQMQIGLHIREFGMVVPKVLRSKGDVVVMGEMRDKDSVEAGVKISETGHATYATLHCETPAEAISRIISEFPYDSQPAIATKVLAALRIIVAQKIVRDTSGKGLAFRSWCVFDHQLKRHLSEQRHDKWSSIIEDHVTSKKQSFAWQGLPALLQGRIGIDAFADVAGMFRRSALDFIQTHAPEDYERILQEDAQRRQAALSLGQALEEAI